MLKRLILPFLVIGMSISVHAQLHMGLAFDYEHIHAENFQNIGSGSEYGGSLLFRIPFSSHLNLDWSFDIGAGQTRMAYYAGYMGPAIPYEPVVVYWKRSNAYIGIPLHLTYSLSSRNVRVFAGPGIAYTDVAATGVIPNQRAGECSFIAGSFKAGCELYRHVVISGEIRPWKVYLTNNENRISNMVSMKLGYEISLKKRSAPSRS